MIEGQQLLLLMHYIKNLCVNATTESFCQL